MIFMTCLGSKSSSQAAVDILGGSSVLEFGKDRSAIDSDTNHIASKSALEASVGVFLDVTLSGHCCHDLAVGSHIHNVRAVRAAQTAVHIFLDSAVFDTHGHGVGSEDMEGS